VVKAKKENGGNSEKRKEGGVTMRETSLNFTRNHESEKQEGVKEKNMETK
jgi:hypothetical protein